MTEREHHQAEELDRQWDRFQDAGQRPSTRDDGFAQVAKLHIRDDAPAPSPEFRQRLHSELRGMHPGTADDPSPAESGDMDQGQQTPATIPSGSPPRRPISFNRPSSFRQWGELAAILLILVVAIAGAALYGDDAYDFTQRQLASAPDDAPISDQREQLLENGAAGGLNFDQAVELVPFNLAEPDSLPEGMGEPEYSVRRHVETSGTSEWTIWSSEALFEIDSAELEPVSLRAQPAWEQMSFLVPREREVEGVIAPAGNLDIVTINGQHVVRRVEITEEREASTRYVWRQGHVDLSLDAPIAVNLNDEQADWVDMPEASFSESEVQQMIASMIDQGPLDDDTEVLQHRGLEMNQIANWLPTAPLSDELPDSLELQRANAWVDGPDLYLHHTTNEDVEDIWVHSFSGRSSLAGDEDAAYAISTDTFDVGGQMVERIILTEPAGSEVTGFLLAVDAGGDLLLPWLEKDTGNALVVYLWEIAGMSFIMGVEVPREHVEQTVDGDTVLSETVSAQDWLALIEQQRAVADEQLDPEELFPALAREATAEDELPEHPQAPGIDEEMKRSRLLGEQDGARFYVSEHVGGSICVSISDFTQDGTEVPGATGCSLLYQAASGGVGIARSGMDEPMRIAYVLPQRYAEVVDENGELIAEVEDQLFAISFESGESRPREMIARGPAGELYLGIGTRVSEPPRPPEQ